VADDTARRPRHRRTVVLAVVGWVLVVAGVSAVASFAITRAGQEVLDPAAAQVPVGAATPAVTPPATSPTSSAPTTTPPATGTGTTTTTTAPPPATAQTTVVNATGGQAGFSCTGVVLTPTFATPWPGWSADRETEGDRVRVEFESGDARTRVFASCQDGRPVTTVEDASRGGSDDDSGGGSGGDDDD
jgi:hypothetical protein